MKVELDWKVLLASIAIIGVLASSLGYILGKSSLDVTTGIRVWSVNNSTSVSTSSTSFVLVPDMNLTIDVSTHTNLVITFSAVCRVAKGEAFLFVKLFVDNSAVSPEDAFVTHQEDYETRSFTWIKDVTKGVHKVTLEWRLIPDIYGSTNYGFMLARSLVILTNSTSA